MSGVRNLANMVANDPSSMSKLKGLGLSQAELAEFVPQGQSRKPKPIPAGKKIA